MADAAVTKPCVGCGTLTTGMCWTDCGMSLCGSPLCSDCHHVDEKYGWRHERRTPDLIPPADALADAQRLREERDVALARVEKLRKALKVTGAVLMSEQNRRGGKPFSGRWSIPAIGFSGTVDDALNQANAALDEDARHG